MADTLQILRATSARPRVTFYSDGVPVDLDSGVPVVTITKPDGTTIASGTVTHLGAAGSGTYEFTLAAQPQVTILDVRWTGTIGGQSQTLSTEVEIIGGLLFTIASLRAMRVAGSFPFATNAVPLITDTQILDVRAAILDEMTQILGYSPVPRFSRETLDSLGGNQLLLTDPGVEASLLLSVSVNGVAGSLPAYSLGPDGILETASGYSIGGGFTAGRRNITVEYVHGTSRPPGNGSQVAMLWAAAQLNPSGFSSATTVSMPDGSSYTYEPSETGRGGFVRHTGIREVDRWLHRWSRLGVA